MTDSTPPLTDDDLSAHLDGAADDRVAARLDQDPAARARLERLSRARDALATEAVPPLADDEIDRLVATALAADDQVVAPLAAHRARRAGRAGPPGWAVAAAVAALLAIGLTLVWQGRNADDAQNADAPADVTVGRRDAERSANDLAAPEGAGTSADSLLPDHGAPTEAPATTLVPSPAAATVALGTFPTPADLRLALATTFPTTAAETTDPAPTAAAVDRCAKQMRLTLSLDDGPSHQGWATVDGKPVLVYEFPSRSYADGSPTTLVAAVGAEACDQVAIFQR